MIDLYDLITSMDFFTAVSWWLEEQKGQSESHWIQHKFRRLYVQQIVQACHTEMKYCTEILKMTTHSLCSACDDM